MKLSDLKIVDGRVDPGSITDLTNTFERVEQGLQSATDGLSEVDKSQLVGPIADGVARLDGELAKLKPTMATLHEILSVLPDAIGAHGPATTCWPSRATPRPAASEVTRRSFFRSPSTTERSHAGRSSAAQTSRIRPHRPGDSARSAGCRHFRGQDRPVHTRLNDGAELSVRRHDLARVVVRADRDSDRRRHLDRPCGTLIHPRGDRPP